MPPKFIRKKNRLPYPQIYQSNNSFFVTICVQDRKCIFVEETPTFPTSTSTFDINNIIQNEWLNIAKYYSNVVLDEFVIMPNHFHGVISFNKTPIANISQKNTNLSKIISTFKTITTKKNATRQIHTFLKNHTHNKPQKLHASKIHPQEKPLAISSNLPI